MLSNPNVDDLMAKAGNRYETTLAIAKRARVIANRRLEKGFLSIKDTVDIAAQEIHEGTALVKLDGEYVSKQEDEEVNLEDVITETVEGILKDLDTDDILTSLEPTEIIEENKPKKRGRKPKAKENENE